MSRRSSGPTPAAGSRNSDFDPRVDDLRQRCTAWGVAIFAQQNSYTTGELGYYARRLAEAGFVALAATNGPALMTVPGGVAPVYCTNPLALPRGRKRAAAGDRSGEQRHGVRQRPESVRNAGKTAPGLGGRRKRPRDDGCSRGREGRAADVWRIARGEYRADRRQPRRRFDRSELVARRAFVRERRRSARRRTSSSPSRRNCSRRISPAGSSVSSRGWPAWVSIFPAAAQCRRPRPQDRIVLAMVEHYRDLSKSWAVLTDRPSLRGLR